MPRLSLRSYGTEIDCHTHHFNQLVLPRHGRMVMEIAGRGGNVGVEHGAFVAAGMAHEYLAGRGDQFFVLDLIDDEGCPDDIVLDELTSAPFFRLTPAQCDLLSYLDRVAPALPSGEGAFISSNGWSSAPLSRERWKRLGESWALLMLESLSLARESRPSASVLPAALKRALDIMRDGYWKKLSIANISREAGLSETRLFLMFRQHLGCTPHAYLSDLRLMTAERLLAETALPIVEIALRSGYRDQSALTRQMQRRRGMTPVAHRRLYRQ